MSNLPDELRKLCAMLNPYAECRSRIDYSCIVCQAADELERITTENERLGRTESLYEELRSIIDGGSETMTHADAVQELHDTDDEVESLEQKLSAAQEIVDSLPKTKDGVPIRPGMDLFRGDRMSRNLYDPIAKLDAYWVDWNGCHIVDDPTKFYSTAEAAQAGGE
jgi:hypothetical protein